MNSRLKYAVVTMSTLLVIILLVGARQGASQTSSDDQYRHLAVYTEVLSRIKSEYVEEPDLKSVTLGALNGLLESVDPYASYLSADQYKQYQKQKGAKKGSIGLSIAKRMGYVSVVDAIPGSPAAKAGLNTGDILESINNVATRDMPLVFAEMLLEGDPGTNVELGVLRFSKPEPTKMTLTRAIVADPPVTAKMLPEQIGLVEIPSVDAGRLREVKNKVEDLQKQGAKKLIIDLRNNPLGAPEDGIKLANLFMDKGLIAYAQGQKHPKQEFQAQASAAVTKLPLTIITNRGTAGAAEVAAAALMENKRAEVVGERTYGNAGIRRTLTMDDGSAVILSVAKYYSPNGKSIQDNGVTPTVPVIDQRIPEETDDENPATTPTEVPASKEDNLLKKAIEVATKGIPQVASTSGETVQGGTGMHPLNIPADPRKK
jgi:carboxyl-terminal processing protease